MNQNKLEAELSWAATVARDLCTEIRNILAQSTSLEGFRLEIAEIADRLEQLDKEIREKL